MKNLDQQKLNYSRFKFCARCQRMANKDWEKKTTTEVVRKTFVFRVSLSKVSKNNKFLELRSKQTLGEFLH